jgi:hypothetical protein
MFSRTSCSSAEQEFEDLRTWLREFLKKPKQSTSIDPESQRLREQGVDDPYDLIKTNELGIYMLSVCRDGS